MHQSPRGAFGSQRPSDITYIPTDEGWLYLAGHKDLFTGELVGYAMGERMTRNLVSQSLFLTHTALG